MKPLTDYIISFINKYEAKPLNPSSLQSLGLDLMWAAGDINKLRDRMAKTEYEGWKVSIMALSETQANIKRIEEHL